jgi:hypothetical protein
MLVEAPPRVAESRSLPRDAPAFAPWPDPTPGQLNDWEPFARFPNVWEGEILGGLLRNEGVPAIVTAQWPGPDLTSRSIVWVPGALVRRAQWVLSWPAPGDAELAFLATGEFPA